MTSKHQNWRSHDHKIVHQTLPTYKPSSKSIKSNIIKNCEAWFYLGGGKIIYNIIAQQIYVMRSQNFAQYSMPANSTNLLGFK